MKKSKGIQKLVEDAVEQGYQIKEDDSSISITKGKNKFPKGILIYLDGSAIRTDLPLTCCRSIKTQKMMRDLLGL